MRQIIIPSDTSSGASNTVKYLKVGTSGCSIYMGEVKVYPGADDISAMRAKAFTLMALEDTTFTFTPSSSQTLSYSTDNGTTWAAFPATGVTASAGQEVSFSGTCVPVESSSTVTDETNWGIGRFSSTGKYHAKGNAMSLLGSRWTTNVSLQGKSYAFAGLFSGSTTLMDAECLLLPATELSDRCYRKMFIECSGMRRGPELPAMTVTDRCYVSMFYGCTSLVCSPKLPATTLDVYCYYQMFYGCSSMEMGTELPAMVVPDYAYYAMFRGCTNLMEAPELPATAFTGTRNYEQMFFGCTKIKNTPKLPVTQLTTRCYRYMFNNCDGLTEAPDLLAENVPSSGYAFMFSSANNIKKIKCLATAITESKVENWFNGAPSSGVFIKDASMTGWTVNSINGIPTGWTVRNCYGNKKYPLTFIARENCTFNFSAATNTTNALQYSVNDGSTWASLPSTGVSVASGGAIMFRGSCVSNGSSGSTSTVPIGGIGKFGSTGAFDIEGNIMSLLYNDNFSEQTSLVGADVFAFLFASTPVVNAENLILPATTLTSYCYIRMFNNCTSLLTTPKLLAENLTNGCYYYMFQGCSSLVDAPELPSMSLSGYCYQGMFNNCTSLVNAPKLPATTLATRCYRYMFYGCTSLVEAPELPAETVSISGYSCMFLNCTNLKYIKCLATDISATDCTSGWTSGVATGGTFVKDPEMTSWTRSTTGIPTTWKDSDYLTFVALERTRFRFNYPVAKEATNKLSYSINGGEWVDGLPSTIYTPYLEKGDKIRWKGNCVPLGSLGNKLFDGIGTFKSTGRFNVEGNVMSLLFGDNYASQVSLDGYSCAFYALFSGNTALMSAENLILPATTLSIHCYRSMFYECHSLTASPELIEAAMATNCYRLMFYNCYSLVKAPSIIKDDNNTMPGSGCSYMFQGCISLTNAPELPATTLANQCYYSMFKGCTSLTTAPELPATTLVTNCYYSMFSGCTNLEYIKALFTTTPTTSYTRYWVSGVASTGVFIKNSEATWDVVASYGVPSGWAISIGHDAIKMGGVWWAEMNIGATSTTDTGLYFQWGDTQGYTASQVGTGEGQKPFKWTDYKYGVGSNPSSTGTTKYNGNDGLTTLEPSDDAAHAAWSVDWRIPTHEEFLALRDAVDTEWVENYQGSGVNGRLMTGKSGTVDEGKILFFPACGSCNRGSVDLANSNGKYWSNTVYTLYSSAYNIGFTDSIIAWNYNQGERQRGFPVRGVLSKN